MRCHELVRGADDAGVVHVGQRHLCPFRRESPGDLETEALGRAGDDGDFTLQPSARTAAGKRHAPAIRLDFPIFDEQPLAVGEITDAAEPRRAGHHFGRVEVDVAGRVGLLDVVADGEQAEPLHQHDLRQEAGASFVFVDRRAQPRNEGCFVFTVVQLEPQRETAAVHDLIGRERTGRRRRLAHGGADEAVADRRVVERDDFERGRFVVGEQTAKSGRRSGGLVRRRNRRAPVGRMNRLPSRRPAGPRSSREVRSVVVRIAAGSSPATIKPWLAMRIAFAAAPPVRERCSASACRSD